MKRTAENLLAHELVGLRVEVLESRDPALRGLVGTVVNETRNTFTLKTSKGLKVVPKAAATFAFLLDEARVRLSGFLLLKRSEERINLLR